VWGRFYSTALQCNAVFLIVKPSVRPSVRPSHPCIVTKQTKVLPIFLYRTKGQFIFPPHARTEISVVKFSWRSDQYFLREVANRQTNRQTDRQTVKRRVLHNLVGVNYYVGVKFLTVYTRERYRMRVVSRRQRDGMTWHLNARVSRRAREGTDRSTLIRCGWCGCVCPWPSTLTPARAVMLVVTVTLRRRGCISGAMCTGPEHRFHAIRWLDRAQATTELHTLSGAIFWWHKMHLL